MLSVEGSPPGSARSVSNCFWLPGREGTPQLRLSRRARPSLTAFRRREYLWCPVCRRAPPANARLQGALPAPPGAEVWNGNGTLRGCSDQDLLRHRAGGGQRPNAHADTPTPTRYVVLRCSPREAIVWHLRLCRSLLQQEDAMRRHGEAEPQPR